MSYPKHHNLFSKLIPVDHNNHVLTKFFSHFLNWILFVKESAWPAQYDIENILVVTKVGCVFPMVVISIQYRDYTAPCGGSATFSKVHDFTRNYLVFERPWISIPMSQFHMFVNKVWLCQTVVSTNRLA